MREYFRSGGKTLPGAEESGLPAVIPGQPGGDSNERVGDDSWEHPPAAYEKGVLTASLEEYQVRPSTGNLPQSVTRESLVVSVGLHADVVALDARVYCPACCHAQRCVGAVQTSVARACGVGNFVGPLLFDGQGETR